MADIIQNFPIKASAAQVFEAISTPLGLANWWTKRSSGEPMSGAEWELWFGPEYDWSATVSRFVPNAEFELKFTKADDDWIGTRVGFVLKEKNGVTQIRFHHLGWPEANDHYEVSCYCWALYLRLLRRYVENGEVVLYEQRLDA